MADFTKLKPKAGDKGEPPPVDATNNNLQTPPRSKMQPKGKAARSVPMGKIQFSVPQSEIEAFSKEAGKQFGFKKGSKSDLFSAMLEHWMASKMS